MGKFINTQRRDTVEGVTSFNTDLLNQDFYLFNTQGKGTKVTYYNINQSRSTLDGGSGLSYTDIGEDSPIRFNRIKDLYIYQMQPIEVNMENGEFGLEANNGDITGESYIIPNEFTPTPGDFFTVDHADNKWLFKVKDSSMNTLQTSIRSWKISWVLDRQTDTEILQNIVEDFQYVETADGTNTKRVVLATKYKLAEKIDNVCESLREYFKDLFYSEYIQSFTYKWYTEYRMYDPYAIEFIKKNHLLISNGMNFMYIDHIVKPPYTFGVSYDRSIFRAFELKNKDKFREYSYQAQANLIDDPTTIFSTRYEQYFQLCYDIVHEANGPFNPRAIIPIMDEDFIDRIQTNHKYTKLDDDCTKLYLNIVIKYFNNEEIKEYDLNFLDTIDFTPVESLFYNLLFVIFVLDWYTNDLLN